MRKSRDRKGSHAPRGKQDAPPQALLRLSPFAAAGIIALVAFAVYANSLGGQFVFDDTVIIQGNKSLEGLDWEHLKEIFGGHYWKAVESQGGLYRPIVMLSYAVNFAMGGSDPRDYHLFNLLLHAANGILVFFLLEALFSQRAFSFLGALFFVLHPIRTEGVASLVGRAESLAALFMLAAWCLYLRYRKTGRQKLLWISALLFGLAALSKESAFAFVLLLPLTDFLRGTRGSEDRSRGKEILLRYLPFGLVLVFVLGIRILVLQGLTPLYINPTSNPMASENWWHRFLTATYVFARYIGLLLFPLDLSADYSYHQIPAVREFFSLKGFLPIALLMSLLAGTVASARRYPMLFFSGAVFFLSFVLTSNWIRPIGTIMGERLMYFPALGFDCAVAFVICKGLENARWRLTAAAVCLALSAGYGLRTVRRNLDWQDHFALFGSAVQTSPESSLVQANFATILLNEKNDARGAVEHARKALSILPGDPAALFTLGQAYRRLGDLPRAVQALEAVAAAAPRTSGGTAALRETAEMHESMRLYEEAASDYERILEWRPSDTSARLGLARVQQALEVIRKAGAEQ